MRGSTSSWFSASAQHEVRDDLHVSRIRELLTDDVGARPSVAGQASGLDQVVSFCPFGESESFL